MPRVLFLFCCQSILLPDRSWEKTLKRGGNFEFVPLDFESGDERYSDEPSVALTPEKVFDARWAITLLRLTMDQLRAEYEGRGKVMIFEVLKPFLDFGNSDSLPTYEAVAESLRVREGAVKTLIHRLRKRHGQILREEVSRTVTDPDEVDSEIRALCDAVIVAEGLSERIRNRSSWGEAPWELPTRRSTPVYNARLR